MELVSCVMVRDLRRENEEGTRKDRGVTEENVKYSGTYSKRTKLELIFT